MKVTLIVLIWGGGYGMIVNYLPNIYTSKDQIEKWNELLVQAQNNLRDNTQFRLTNEHYEININNDTCSPTIIFKSLTSNNYVSLYKDYSGVRLISFIVTTMKSIIKQKQLKIVDVIQGDPTVTQIEQFFGLAKDLGIFDPNVTLRELVIKVKGRLN